VIHVTVTENKHIIHNRCSVNWRKIASWTRYPQFSVQCESFTTGEVSFRKMTLDFLLLSYCLVVELKMAF